jgi:hypothetical protein
MMKYTRASIIETCRKFEEKKRAECAVEYQKVMRELNTAASSGRLDATVHTRYDLKKDAAIWCAETVKCIVKLLHGERIKTDWDSSSALLKVWIELDEPAATVESADDSA